jgi:signal transduction histidine kinase/HAMP domain-containing protein
VARLPMAHSRWRYRWSLRVRLVAVVLLGLLPIAVLLGFLWQGARERDRDDTLRNLTQTTEAVAVIADDLFDEGITLGHAIATDPAVQALDPARFIPRLRELNARSPHYTNIIVVDSSGTLLGWTAPEPLPTPAPTVAERPFFARVNASGQPTTIRVVDDHGPRPLGTGVAVPIVGPDGSVVGMVAITFDPDHVGNRLDQVRLFPGQALNLIDPNGRVAVLVGRVSRSVADLTWEQRDRHGLPEVQAALAGELVATTTYRSPLASPGSEPRLAAFVPTPRHGWVVSAAWPVAEALGPTRQAEQRELTIFLGIVLVILGGALVVSRALITPLQRLAEHARRLGDGRFEPIMGIQPDDEIGDLTTTFNVMGERLHQTIDDLRHERARLETVLYSLPVGVVIRAAPSEALILGNAQAERIWRRSFVARRKGDPTIHARSFHPDGRPYEREEWPIIRSIRAGEEVRDEELTIRRGDGTEGAIVMSSAPIRDAAGQIIAAVAAFDDVTERRQTEARLREREELLRALVDQFPGAVAVLDRDLRYVFAAGRRLVNPDQPRHELVGSRLVDIYPARNVAAAALHYQRAFAGETVSYDTSIAGRSLRVTITPLRDVDGAVEHVLTVGFDVTEEREQLDRVVRDEKLHALGQMAGGIAHNLNQTLALVTGYGELVRAALDQAPPDLDELRRMLRIVERAAYDGGETVKRLLTFARGQGDERRQSIDVADLLHEVEQLTAPRWRESASAEGRPVELQVEVEPGILVIGARAGLREALTNLVFNALDAMPRGGTIALSARRSADRVLLSVADTGDGMSPEVRRQIFEPFFTTKGDQGTGLGLAMVFGIVRHHGGQIDVTSEPGRGTTIRLSLPVGMAEESDVPAAANERPARALRILIVDDEARLAALAAGMLRRDGHQTTEASSGQEALERLHSEPFDLVISDLSMGDGMNGWELAAATDQLVPGLPIVLATGWGAAIDEAEARSRGISAVLAKPFRIADLREVVARVIPA